MEYAADGKNVKLIGRTCDISGNRWFWLSGTGVEFTLEAAFCTIVFKADSTGTDGPYENQARIAVYVNGERKHDFLLDKPEIKLEINAGEGKNVVRVIKLSESAMSGACIEYIESDGKIAPTAAKEHKLEIIGDSITCGYGVDDENELHNFKTATEDVTRAYSYLTAEALGCDYSFVSYSGYGIISGYTGEGVRNPKETLPQYYEKVGFSYGKAEGDLAPSDIAWDFSEYVPELIVINLGTNDDSFCLDFDERKSEYRDRYAEFLGTVRKNNPDAYILCILGLMGERLCPTLEESVRKYSAESGDKRISTMMLKDQLPSDGYAANFHPTGVTHGKTAVKLTGHIKTLNVLQK